MRYLSANESTNGARDILLTRVTAVLVIGMCATLAAGCQWAVQTATREPVSLAYVGDVEFGQPISEESRVVVPLRYEGGEWAKNSAIGPVGLTCEVNDREVQMTVITALGPGAAEDVRPGQQLVLPAGSKGEYTVVYRDPDGTRHNLGVINVGE